MLKSILLFFIEVFFIIFSFIISIWVLHKIQYFLRKIIKNNKIYIISSIVILIPIAIGLLILYMKIYIIIKPM